MPIPEINPFSKGKLSTKLLNLIGYYDLALEVSEEVVELPPEKRFEESVDLVEEEIGINYSGRLVSLKYKIMSRVLSSSTWMLERRVNESIDNLTSDAFHSDNSEGYMVLTAFLTAWKNDTRSFAKHFKHFPDYGDNEVDVDTLMNSILGLTARLIVTGENIESYSEKEIVTLLADDFAWSHYVKSKDEGLNSPSNSSENDKIRFAKLEGGLITYELQDATIVSIARLLDEDPDFFRQYGNKSLEERYKMVFEPNEVLVSQIREGGNIWSGERAEKVRENIQIMRRKNADLRDDDTTED